jgi:hypothetical protein
MHGQSIEYETDRKRSRTYSTTLPSSFCITWKELIHQLSSSVLLSPRPGACVLLDYLAGTLRHGGDRHESCVPKLPIVGCQHSRDMLERRGQDSLSTNSTC